MKLPQSHQNKRQGRIRSRILNLRSLHWHEGPVIGKGMRVPKISSMVLKAEGSSKQDGWYHLFTSEQAGDPKVGENETGTLEKQGRDSMGKGIHPF